MWLRRAFWLVLLSLPAYGQVAASLPWLSTSGTEMVDSAGNTVILRGVNAGGALLAEPFMAAIRQEAPAGFPQVRDEKTLWDVTEFRFGNTAMRQLRQTWRTAWFNDSDVPRLAVLGVNVVRIPFFYRLLEDDANPGQLLPEGLAILDALLDACARNRVYAILDMHGAPGAQSDVYTTGQEGVNLLFGDPAYQERTARLWAAIAGYYRDRPEIAGYDLLNEPFGAADAAALIAVHDRIYRAIRAVDQRHVLFMEDGGKGVAAFPDPRTMGWENVAYSIHIYFPSATSSAVHQQYIDTVLPSFRLIQQLDSVPFFVGEFSTLTDMQGGVPMMVSYFRAFAQYGWSWTLWNYKYVDPVDGQNSIIGLFTNAGPWDPVDLYRDSFDSLQYKFARYDTPDLVLQPGLADALRAAAANTVPNHCRVARRQLLCRDR